ADPARVEPVEAADGLGHCGSRLIHGNRAPADICYSQLNTCYCQSIGRAGRDSSMVVAMEWSDEGVGLSVRPPGEAAAVVELFTRAHGRHLGLVHGGRSRRLRPVLQIGNHVDATWKARLADNLGHFAIELRRGFAASLMDDAAALAAITSMASLSRL